MSVRCHCATKNCHCDSANILPAIDIILLVIDNDLCMSENCHCGIVNILPAIVRVLRTNVRGLPAIANCLCSSFLKPYCFFLNLSSHTINPLIKTMSTHNPAMGIYNR